MRLPIGVVQHLPSSSRIDVGLIYGGTLAQDPTRYARPRLAVEVEDKMPIESGFIYMAAPGYHLLLERDRTFGFTQDELENYSRPSIDVFFRSVASVYGSSAIGILLTGANSDGASGLAEISAQGGLTIVQEPSEAECDTMPKSAIALKQPNYVLSLSGIADYLNQLRSVRDEVWT